MAYQVLARKWRPQTFQETVGQHHVLDALAHALKAGRLHHAYLFTGTRGVGKTSIARILAKCLSCEQGITDRPCGQCQACQSIEQGRFVDLIEIDAASRTKVEDTRELLDNVQYAPTQGRFKIYLIDEVHMLSTHSFNALLKTLEEPPEHVKFILCTTDPQKLPITVISRCMQFTLKHLKSEEIEQQLTKVLTQEEIGFEQKALSRIADKAHGSMRDALSLLDQAIALGQGEVTFTAVQEMLGVVDQALLGDLLQHIAAGDAPNSFELLEQMTAQSIQAHTLLDDLARLLVEAAHVQVDPQWSKTSFPIQTVQALSKVCLPEVLQVWYQMVIKSKETLDLAPDLITGLEMLILRLLAFLPLDEKESGTISPQENASSINAIPKKTSIQKELRQEASNVSEAKTTQECNASSPSEVEAAVIPEEASINKSDLSALFAQANNKEQLIAFWKVCVEALSASGMAKQLARHCEPLQKQGSTLTVFLDKAHGHLLNVKFENTLKEAFAKIIEKGDLKFEIMSPNAEEGRELAVQQSPAAITEREIVAEQKALEDAMLNDPAVKYAIEQLGGQVIPGSIQKCD